jgi:hypothetical protein
LAEGDLPSGLQRLEELIGLEECADDEGIENAKGDEK